jgi:hypothetical protein
MTVWAIVKDKRWMGLSTDTKPVGVLPGSIFKETNTGFTWIYNGYAWLPDSYMPGMTVNYKQISLHQVAGDYDVMTATAQNLFLDAVVVHVPAVLSAVETFTGISIQTTDVTPVEILSAVAGAKASLTGDFYHIYRGPVVTASTKKIQVTIGGATAGEGSVVDITVLWRPLVAGGYMLNA